MFESLRNKHGERTNGQRHTNVLAHEQNRTHVHFLTEHIIKAFIQSENLRA